MDYHQIKGLLARPTIRVLSIDSAPLLLAFFHAAFKTPARLGVAEEELRTQLAAYLRDLREDDPDLYPATAGEYLSDWCRPERGFLRRYYIDGQNEPLIELTASSEKALTWLQTLYEAEFVATESRLESVFRDVEDLVRRASPDPDLRIADLLLDIAKLQDEIAQIRETGVADTYTPVQINERFGQLLATARELASDFRQVEENFRTIARQIAERQAEPNITKGEIVAHMLDANDALRESAQGQSFYAFWRLLLSDEKQRGLKEAIQRAYSIPDLEDRLRGNRFLVHLVRHLLTAGEKVTKSNEHMSANLRRVLDTADLLERARVRELIKEVQAAALAVKHHPPSGREFFSWDDQVPVFNTMNRDLWIAGEEVSGTGVPEEGDNALSLDDMLRFQGLPQIQLRQLRENIASVLLDKDMITLDEILVQHPPEHGMIEVIGYYIVAAENPYNLIDNDSSTRVVMPDGRGWRVPAVVFSRP